MDKLVMSNDERKTGFRMTIGYAGFVALFALAALLGEWGDC